MYVGQVKKKNRNVFVCEDEVLDVYIGSATKDSIKYYFLYDSNYEPIQETFSYIYDIKKNLSNNSKYSIICSIRQLYLFCTVFKKKLIELSSEDSELFKMFVLGEKISSTSVQVSFIRNCSSKTSRRIFNDCREFCKYLKIDFLKEQDYTNNYYLRNRNNQLPNCPKFISYEEYKRVLKAIDNDRSITRLEKKEYKLIVKLMYMHGLRIGEVLGLTYEDIKEEKIIIRNRLSDKPYQSAKRCSRPKRKEDYNKVQYINDCQKVVINKKTYYELMDYICILQKRIKRKKKRFDKAKADSIETYDNNFYIFLNKQNSPLSSKSWNAYLRKIFMEINIDVDEGRRINNLNHKFRHGYIMYLLYVLKMSSDKVMKYSRHKSICSLEIYNNPTDEQLAKIHIDMERSKYGDELF